MRGAIIADGEIGGRGSGAKSIYHKIRYSGEHVTSNGLVACCLLKLTVGMGVCQVHLYRASKIKVKKKIQNSRNKGFS
jgi:hypothetical protein